MQDRKPTARRNLLATHGRTIHVGQKRRFDRAPITSGLPPIDGHFQGPSACLKGASIRYPWTDGSDACDGAVQGALLDFRDSKQGDCIAIGSS
jgi:hypothetical protein